MAGVLHGWGSTLSYLSSRMGAFWTILVSLFIYLALDAGKDLLKEDSEQEEETIEEQPGEQSDESNEEKEMSFEEVFNEVMQKKKGEKGDK